MNYEDMTSSFGEVLVEVEEGSYQGNTWVLLKHKGRFGYLAYDWGSCSGCDALEACDDDKELEELHTELWKSIKWNKNLPDLLDGIRVEIEKDEKWMQNPEETGFLKQCEKFLVSGESDEDELADDN